MPGGNQNLQRVRAITETTFGADMSATIVASGYEVRAHPSQPDIQKTMLKDESNRQRAWEDRLDFVGPEMAEFPLKMHLAGSGLPLNDAAVAPTVPRTSLTKIARSVFGGWTGDRGDLAAAGSTTAVINSTVGARFEAGGAIIVPTGVGGALEMREIASKATNALTLKTLTTNALGTGGAIHNTECIYPEDHGSILESLAFLVESIQRKDVWWLRGCQAVGGFTIETPQGERPTISFAMKAAGYLHDTQAAVPIAGALGAATYTDADPSVLFKSELLFGNSGSTARATLDTYSISFKPSWGFESIPTVGGLNGIAGYFPTKPEPSMECTFVVRVDDASPYDETMIKTEWAARTKKRIFLQIGNVAGSIVGISLPCVQITNVKRAAGGTMRAWEITAKVLEDETATDKTTAKRRAPWRLFFA